MGSLWKSSMKSLNDMLRDIQKRYGVMAIVLAFAGVLSAAVVMEPLTNATALVGVPLSTNELARLPSCDASSPDTVFLGTVKALRSGNLRELYYHFETNYLFGLTGLCGTTNISEDVAASFGTVMNDSDFSNLVVVAYSTLSSNQQVSVSASLRENFTVRTMTEPLSLTLRREATGWKIVAFDDDKWNE